MELVAPEVGELVTSLDMAGCSLSVTWLDEELERYWVAPADTPAFRRGDAVASERFTTRRTGTEQLAEAETPEASEDSIAAAAVARKAVDAIYATVEENKEYLGQIDAIAGDGDHGIGMSRGSKAAAEAAQRNAGWGRDCAGGGGPRLRRQGRRHQRHPVGRCCWRGSARAWATPRR